MSLLQLATRRWRKAARWEELVEELAQVCVGEVQGRLSEQVYHMSRHESRGYVRARAGAVITRVVDSAVRDGRIPATSVPLLRGRVLEATTHLVQHGLAMPPAGFFFPRAA